MQKTLPNGKWRKRLKIKALPPFAELHKVRAGNCKIFNDKYFGIRSLKDIINDYNNDPRTKRGLDNDGKAFYKVITLNLEKAGITERSFITYLCDDICSYEDIAKFVEALKKLLN